MAEEAAVIYLSGAISKEMLAHPRPDIGVMLNPAMGNYVNLGALPWAADNGCFSQGERFDATEWLVWLASLNQYRRSNLFAVLPDVVGDAPGTWERSLPYVSTLQQLGYKPAYVSQDHETRWPEGAEALFIGGTDKWKLCEASYELAAKAKAAGLWVHVGRVNSLRRLESFAAVADSADGTYVKYGPERNLPNVWNWLDKVNAQACLLA